VIGAPHLGQTAPLGTSMVLWDATRWVLEKIPSDRRVFLGKMPPIGGILKLPATPKEGGERRVSSGILSHFFS